MANKIFSSVFLFAFALLGFGVFGVASAQVATPVPFPTFPAGCASGLGYSVSTGSPCSGTAIANTSPLPGCSTALGYSVTTGAACSGVAVAIPYLAGCTSIFGYSSITAQPCNGTAFAEGAIVPPPVPPVIIPGLPTTGAGGNAPLNIALLLGSGIISLLGVAYFVKRSKIA